MSLIILRSEVQNTKHAVSGFKLCFFCLQAEGENEVNNELANRISLFYADATPMLKTLSDGTTKFVSEVRLRNKNIGYFISF